MASVVRQRKQNNGKRDPKKLAGRKLSAIGRNEEVPSNPNPADIGIVYPSGDTAFKALLSARFCAAMWNSISDCDETFNYWEPSHYLLFGKGFQTWEYSPEYALRSYTYLLIHVVPAWLYHQLLQPNRFLIFYFSRCLLGLLCAFCEVYFYNCPGFEFFRLNIMADPSKKMHISDEVFYELLQENEYSGISGSEYDGDSEINVNISSGGE